MLHHPPAAVAQLDLKDIRKSFGQTDVLRGVDLQVADGELVVLVGPSGCGKSTLLRTIAGLESPTSGTIRIGERNVTALPPKDRDIGMVFQSYALYPHLSVRRNLGFGLELRKVDKATIQKRTTEVAKMLGLSPLLDRLPRQLSGGQRQRVAMGRAIVRRPGLFLFDEPLSNLDAALRAEVRVEIKRLHADLGATMVYVTHDQVEAMTLADRLVVLNAGRVEQVGPPMALYDTPASRFVGAFIGSPAMNFLDAEVKGGKVMLKSGAILETETRDGSVILGVRPHDVHVADSDSGALSLEVDVVEAMGFESYVHGSVLGTRFIARVDGEATPKRGQTLSLGVDRMHLFDPDSGARL